MTISAANLETLEAPAPPPLSAAAADRKRNIFIRWLGGHHQHRQQHPALGFIARWREAEELPGRIHHHHKGSTRFFVCSLPGLTTYLVTEISRRRNRAKDGNLLSKKSARSIAEF